MQEGEEEGTPKRQAQFVRLMDGRRIAYRERGCPPASAQRSMIALHGLMSSRLGAMPGAREEVLVEYGLRLIMIDRPGYGESDPHPAQTFRSSCKDIVAVANALQLGKRFWLHGYSMGGAFCWAAARYIPDRIEGIAMWCPVGNLRWKGMRREERKQLLHEYSAVDRALCFFGRHSPFFLTRLYSRLLCYYLNDPSIDLTAGLSATDKKSLLQHKGMAELLFRDRVESFRRNKGYGVAKDFELMNKGWDFEVEEVGDLFKRKIHIWQGEEDRLVSTKFQRWVQKQLPNVVVLHELQGEGHLSLFAGTNLDRITLRALFGVEGKKDSTEISRRS